MSEKPKSINQEDINLELMESILTGSLDNLVKKHEGSE